MTAFFSAMTEWHWLVLGLLLIAAEIVIPGTFLLWPGLSAILVGLLNVIAPAMPWTASIAIWAVLSLMTVGGFILYRRQHPAIISQTTLNRRGTQYIGQIYTLEKPVVNGKGELRVDDSVWKIVSDKDLSAATQVIVTGLEGTSLRITAENQAKSRSSDEQKA